MMECPDTLPKFKLIADSDIETTMVDTTIEDMDVLSETCRNSLHHLAAYDSTQQIPEGTSGNELLNSDNMCSVMSTDNCEENTELSTYMQHCLPKTIFEYNVGDTDRTRDEIDSKKEFDSCIESSHDMCLYANFTGKTFSDLVNHDTMMPDTHKHVNQDLDAQHNLRCSIYTSVIDEIDTNLEKNTCVTDESNSSVERNTCITDESNTNLEKNIYVTDENNTNLERRTCITDETDTNLERKTCITDETDINLERNTCITDEMDTNLERNTCVTDETDTNLERNTCVTDESDTNLERKTCVKDEIDTDLERKVLVTNQITGTNSDIKTFVTDEIATDLGRKTSVTDEIDTDSERKAFETDEFDTNLENNSSKTEQNDTVSGRQTYLNPKKGATCIQSENRLGIPVIGEDRDSYDVTDSFHFKSSENVTNDGLFKRDSDCVESNAVPDNSSVTVACSELVTATPLEGFSEKEALVAAFGILLVIMCIEIYNFSSKPSEETNLLERTDDLGLNLLFQTEEVPGTSREARRNIRTRSRSARKRKKQQQKLLGRMPVGKRKNRFAEKFEDLRRPVYEDLLTDVDHSITCPICLEMYYLPCLCQPCGHIFCDPCLRRLTYQGSEGVLCPLCRTVIQCCVADKEFNDQLMMSHADIFSVRHSTEKKSKYRHFHLPFTPPAPLSQRLMRHLVTNRNNLPVNEGTLYNVSKLLVGLLTGTCISVLIMLLSHVRGIHSARDVNIMFLSFCTGAIVTILFYKVMRL